jgi:hypothetical protein
MRSLVTGLLIMAISFFVYAQKNTNCAAASSVKEVSFVNELGNIRDQDGDGWCYAYGGADQLTHWLNSHGVPGVETNGGGRVSPVGLALDQTEKSRRQAYLNYNAELAAYKSRNDQLNATANAVGSYMTALEIKDAAVKKLCAHINHDSNGAIVLTKPAPSGAPNSRYLDLAANDCHMARRKLCQADSQCRDLMARADNAQRELQSTATKIPQFHFPAGGSAKAVMERALSEGVCLESSVASDGFDPRLGVNVNQLLTTNSLTENCEDCRRESSIRAVFPKFQGNVAAILDNYVNADPMSEFMKSCQRVQGPKPPPRIREFPPEDFSRELEKPGSEPIGVTYNPSIFTYSDESVAATYGFVSQDPKTESKLHYSLLAGKRYNCDLGEEEFIIKNSWGSGACELSRNKYVSVPKSDPRVAEIERSLSVCVQACPTGNAAWNTCNKTCVDARNVKANALQKPPFYCEDGLFVVPASVMKRASVNGNKIE